MNILLGMQPFNMQYYVYVVDMGNISNNSCNTRIFPFG